MWGCGCVSSGVILEFTVIPQDDGLSAYAGKLRRDKMDLWIAGLLVLSSKKNIDVGF